MLSSEIKTSVSRVLAVMPRSVRHVVARLGRAGMTNREKLCAGIPTLEGLLETSKDNGFSPTTILDIGANIGDWSRTVASIFPTARIIMFDANEENAAALSQTATEFSDRASYVIALLGSNANEFVPFYKLGTGSSVLPELTTYEKETVVLPMNTLDNLTQTLSVESPILLKLDVQGFELEVLRGGKRILELCELVLIEVSLIPYNEGAPLFADVVAFMSAEGFLVFDFCGQSRRQTDNALFQTDVAFVRRDSSLRQKRKFWLGEP